MTNLLSEKDINNLLSALAEGEVKDNEILSVLSEDKVKNTEIRPDYYKIRNYEPKDVIRDWGLNFNLGNVVKYISRAGLKTRDPYEDLKKAQTYLQFEIDALEEGRNNGK